ncbi:MAG: hypothetical protein HC836_33845 [Richelia sp. RM2_1_2]|nr:hypothetical protein [Richelia sp. RM2_1_2]
MCHDLKTSRLWVVLPLALGRVGRQFLNLGSLPTYPGRESLEFNAEISHQVFFFLGEPKLLLKAFCVDIQPQIFNISQILLMSSRSLPY